MSAASARQAAMAAITEDAKRAGLTVLATGKPPAEGEDAVGIVPTAQEPLDDLGNGYAVSITVTAFSSTLKGADDLLHRLSQALASSGSDIAVAFAGFDGVQADDKFVRVDETFSYTIQEAN